ncbi:DUF1761 domain-containing protein [Altericroceibacterium xinjiangense]|uniref:DUF1761 domain-containing protein n=1 Tax=Altericroceibacterium xinjiangense TaxID=762261 RepID=UPI000F7DF1E3|nr:DUF1761 domain-containing protein [Altericroceibacterium xinjiangense]
MGNINLLAVFLATAAFFILGLVWYGPLFGGARNRAVRGRERLLHRRATPVTWALVFLFELVICWMLGHLFARIHPSPNAILMISGGFGATIMAPAVGIATVLHGKPGRLLAIDAGYFTVGMLLAGTVFLLMG